MIFSNIRTNPGEVSSISLTTDYIADPLSLFTQLSQDRTNSLLLESAEIDSKDHLKSIMVIDAAVKIVCHGRQVSLHAMTPNGLSVLAFLQEKLQPHAATNLTDESLIIDFPPYPANQTEEERLKFANAFEVLRTAINEIKTYGDNPFSLFLGGAFAYDMIGTFEDLPDVPTGFNNCPDYCFYLAETLILIDHQEQTTQLMGNVFSGEHAIQNCFEVGKRLELLQQACESFVQQPPQPEMVADPDAEKPDVSVNINDEAYRDQVIALKKNIVDGDVFQVVPSRSFFVKCPDSIAAYRQLKKQNPSPYMFYMNDSEFVLFGASPESALKYEASSRQVEVYPIAGTRRRGFKPDGSIDLDLDSRIELELREDTKEKAEHLMLVDLARNDIARISNPGTRFVKELLKVDRYSYVMHLVSRVIGTLRDDLDALHAYQACMNMGTLVGAPKVKAAEILRHVETQRRGSYGGAVGYLTGNGDMDSCIVIRSALVKGGTACVQAGAGVVFDSDPQSEADETRSKAQAVVTAIQASQMQKPVSFAQSGQEGNES